MGSGAEALESGQMLGGKYVVDRRLGAGGMGTVYAAENVAIGRRVAIKVLNDVLAGDQALLTRFHLEARAAALIRHPGIVDVLDMGTAADGAPFIVMEMLEGETLGALVEGGARLEPRLAIALVASALDALAAAHRAGIVHRDLKPDNVFVCRDGPSPVKLLDFGISKFTMAESVSATRTGVVMGTPLYMAPEQIRSAKEAGQSADLYAVGAILFHALTGTPPFVGNTFSDIVARAMSDPVPSLRGLRPDLPGALAEIVETLLSKSPADRPQDAAVVAARLRAIDLGSVSTEKNATPPTHRPPARLRKPAFVASLVGALALSSVGAALLHHRAGRTAPRAMTPVVPAASGSPAAASAPAAVEAPAASPSQVAAQGTAPPGPLPDAPAAKGSRGTSQAGARTRTTTTHRKQLRVIRADPYGLESLSDSPKP